MNQRTVHITFWSSVSLILYTYFGYPLLLALWSKLRPRPVQHNHTYTPMVSLIIVAYNEEQVIAEKLANSFALDYPPEQLEIIVVADGSNDQTSAIVSREPRVRLLYQPERRGKMAALNRAAAAANGEILVFSDANNMYQPQTLRELLAPFADPAVGMVTGRKQIDDGSGRNLDKAEALYWRYESQIKTWESQIGSVSGAVGEIMAVRRVCFRPPPEDIVSDDFVLAMQAAIDGWRVAYAPKALSLERASATLNDETRRRSRLVAGRFHVLWWLLPRILRRNPQFAWQVISHKVLRPLVPFAMISAAISNLAGRSSPLLRWLALCQSLFYGAALLGWWIERRGYRHRLLYIPYYFCRVNLAALYGFQRILNIQNAILHDKVQRG